jgi:diguanylate cyclase
MAMIEKWKGEELLEELFEAASNGSTLSNGNLHIILNALPTPLSWASLPGGEIQFVNRAFKKTFGYADDSFATVDDWIDRGHTNAADRDQARLLWTTRCKAETVGMSEIDVAESQVRCADGTVLTVQARNILLYGIGVVITTFEDITARKLAENTLRRIAFEDPLTGLPNRRALEARWRAEMMERPDCVPSMLVLLLVDLDGFKRVNDDMGHDVGDEALMAVSDRLRNCVRAGDSVYRMGGDEFVILLPACSAELAEQICHRIERSFEKTFTLEDQHVTLGTSVGASLYPRHAVDLRGLLKHADEALYRIKKSGKGGWAWFKPPQMA